MSDDDPGRLLQRLLDLVGLATSPNENEARNAAMKACELIREHRDGIRFGDERVPRGGQVHSLVALFHANHVVPTKAESSGWCLSCGEAYERGARIVSQYRVGTTHYECREWWRGFDFGSLPPEPEEGSVSCRNCGTNVPFDTTRCPRCGFSQ